MNGESVRLRIIQISALSYTGLVIVTAAEHLTGQKFMFPVPLEKMRKANIAVLSDIDLAVLGDAVPFDITKQGDLQVPPPEQTQ